MISKRAALLLLGVSVFELLLSGAESQAAQSTAVDLLVGSWNSVSAAFYGENLTIERQTLTMGKCNQIHYTVIRDQPGRGRSLLKENATRVWREIAIELMPSNPLQERCLQWRVMDISIPADKERHAEIALFSTRADFDTNSDYDAWGVWEKPPSDKNP